MSAPSVAAVRLAEVVASLSLATDLGMGQPMQHALRACLLGLSLGEALGLDEEALGLVYYVALLQRVGCTADAFELTAWFDDDLTPHARAYELDFGKPLQVIGDLLRYAGAGRSPLDRLRTLGGALGGGEGAIGALFAASCEVARRLGERLGLERRVIVAVGQVFERWDGRGWPAQLRGEEIDQATRIARFAADIEVARRRGGLPLALSLARARAATVYDPRVVAAFCRGAERLLDALDVPSPWEACLTAEPGSRPLLAEADLDEALGAMADFVDLKSPSFAGHSTGVARLAGNAAGRAGLPPSDLALVRRAGLVHDLGRTGVSSGIWEKRGALSDDDWEQVRLHPYFTERVLARSPVLAGIGALAALHHERLDGSGYHRGARGPTLPFPARILAAADAYHAMTEPRPHRPARSSGAAAETLRAEVRAGRLDGDAVAAVLDAAGHRAPRRTWPAGLSAREVEVLRLVARGWTNAEIARRLSISPNTAGHHVRHIYDKIGVSSRAAATLFAMEHELLGGAEGS